MKNVYTFRETFKRWKHGERYWSVIGKPLPTYQDGKDTFWDQLGKALEMTYDPREQYDYVNYLLKYGSLDPTDTSSGHYTDEFKLPGHPTFSDESIYSNQTTPGGHWHNDYHYEFSDYTFKNSDATLDYLNKYGPDVVTTYKGGVVLPSITVYGNKKGIRIKPRRKSVVE